MLTEGTSIRGTARITGNATNTILSLLERVGEACSGYQDEHIRGLLCDFVEMDEIHSMIAKKGNDIWCWIALCAKSKLRLTWHVGDRSQRSAMAFCHDVAQRIRPGAQVTTDGLANYRFAVTSAMPAVHFAQLVKVYSPDNEHVMGISKMPIQGDPMPEHISTSYVEASNLHMRMQNRRYARRTNAHSKILANHCHMIALGFMSYNYVRKHGTLRTTPAVAASLTDHQWTMAEVVEMSDRWHATKINEKFEAAFTQRASLRTHPKSYPPTPKEHLDVPWYLDPNGTPPEENEDL